MKPYIHNHYKAAILLSHLLKVHIEEHQEFAQRQIEALGNTKEFGANTGDLINNQSGAAAVPQQGATGAFTPAEGRA